MSDEKVRVAAEGFAATPNWMIRDESVSGYAIAVYTALASHSGPGGIHPAQGTIAAEARCSESSVRRALLELEALGVVERVRRKNALGRASNGYVLHPNGHLAVDEASDGVAVTVTDTAEVPVPGEGGSGQGGEVAPYTEEEPTQEEAPIVPTAIADMVATPEDLFDAAWGYWPKKTEKKLSRVRFIRALKKRPTLMADVAAFGRAYAQTTEVRFVPALAVWIGHERWDEPLPAGRGRSQVSPTDRAMATIALGRQQPDQRAIG